MINTSFLLMSVNNRISELQNLKSYLSKEKNLIQDKNIINSFNSINNLIDITLSDLYKLYDLSNELDNYISNLKLKN